MPNSCRVLLTLAAASALCGSAAAQSDAAARIQPITTPVKEGGIYHVATKTWTRGVGQMLTSPFDRPVLYDNTCTVGYYLTVQPFETIVDEGRLPSTTSPLSAESVIGHKDEYLIQTVELGYCTSELEGTDLFLGIYECMGVTGCDDQTLNATLLKTIDILDAPASSVGGELSCWTILVDFTGVDQFQMKADCDGTYLAPAAQNNFAWEFGIVDGGTPLGFAGPLLAGNPYGIFGGTTCPIASGTIFSANPGPGTGMGNLDSYTSYLPGPSSSLGATMIGCFYFGGYSSRNPYAGFYCRLAGEASVCPPVTGNPPLSKVFELDGLPTNTTWSWRISGPGFAGISDNDAGPVASTGTVLDVAEAFVTSIEDARAAAGCDAASIYATATPVGPIALLTIFVDAPSFHLAVGPGGGPVDCKPSESPDPPNCTINPTIREIPLSGLDCNLNGQDDVLDIALGASQDLNGNWIPDECESASSYCTGDGSGTPCPCGNTNDGSNGAAGCANSAGAGGGKLTATGSNSIAAGDLVLSGSTLQPGQAGLYLQGNNATGGGNGSAFGDGLRCAGGAIVRLQIRNSGMAGASSTTVDIPGVGGVSAGDIRRYQLWYRDTAGPCGTGFNFTNGLEVTWTL